MTDSERIKEVLKFSDLSANKFANHIGLKTSQIIYDIIKGKYGISKPVAEKITGKYLNINSAWLLTGEGGMLKEDFPEEEEMTLEKLKDVGAESFATILLQLFKDGEIFSAQAYKDLSYEYQEIVKNKDAEIKNLHQELGHLKAVIEMMKGKTPEEILEMNIKRNS